ncbi:MAG: PEP/pyruvate-binding domain-containing protein [Dehalococcoidia bacterium]|nr:PEP/pyruvate-binding domain-containing protein [Dehalococcoidia bacterium]
MASAWAALSPGSEPVAVRSSAVDEDGEQASFAGMHETVLNVTDRDGLLDAIETCIVSAEGEAASAYREQRGAGSGERPGIAVVVQRMVSPDAAGVAFSIDPVGGSDEAVVIEAVEGTAERLVGGEVTGYRAEVARADRSIRKADDGALALLGEGGARAVAKLALEAEELFGAPQDIEWAWADDEAWILQSRAVTTALAAKPDAPQGWVSEFDTQTDDETVWTSANVQEVLPGLLTPLSMSIYRESSRVGYNVGFQKLGMLARDEWQPFMGTFYNRAFLNLSTTRMLADRAIGTSAESVDEQYLAGERGSGGEREPLSQRLRFKARSAFPLLRMTLRLPAAADRMDRSTRELEREMHALDPSALSNDELMTHLDRVLRHGASIFATHLQVSGTALFGFEATRKLVQGVLGEETDGRMPTLFGGMRNVESAAIGLDLWNLAVVAKNTGIADRLAEDAFDPEDPTLPDGWRAAWRQFVERHGHRGMNEMEASARSWRRYPEQVLQVIRGYLDLPEGHAPPAITDRQERERLRLTAKIASRLNPVKRRVFRKVLSDAQGWVALRERTKSVIVPGGADTRPLPAGNPATAGGARDHRWRGRCLLPRARGHRDGADGRKESTTCRKRSPGGAPSTSATAGCACRSGSRGTLYRSRQIPRTNMRRCCMALR